MAWARTEGLEAESCAERLAAVIEVGSRRYKCKHLAAVLCRSIPSGLVRIDSPEAIRCERQISPLGFDVVISSDADGAS